MKKLINTVPMAPVFLGVLLFLASCSSTPSAIYGNWELTDSKINGVIEEQHTPISWKFKSKGRFLQIMHGPDGPIERAGDFTLDVAAGELHLHFDRGSDRHVLWVLVGLDEHSLNVEYTGYGFFVEREFRKQ